MTDRNLESWVQDKLEEGLSRERIKSVLENSDKDPSVVDEVESPFDSTENAENAFEPEEDEGESERDTEEEEADEISGEDGEEEEYEFNYDGEEADDGGFSLPDISFPSVSLPGFSLPSVNMSDLSFPEVPWRLLFVVLVIGGAIYGGSRVLGTDGNQTVQQPQPANELDQRCPDVGVRIVTVSASALQVDVEGRVSRGPAEVVIELYNNGNMVAVKQEKFDGVREFTFNQLSADSVVMRPVGCHTIRDSVSLG